MEITVVIRTDGLSMGAVPERGASDKPIKGVYRNYPNTVGGFDKMRVDVQRVLNQAGKQIPFCHTLVPHDGVFFPVSLPTEKEPPHLHLVE
jgi:hypothetical protein